MSVTDSLKRGSTELVLLHLLSECDRHGYELKTLLKEKSHGFYQLADTSMYPVLYRLEQEGYISARRVLVGKRRFRIMYHLEDSG